jgi:ubiquinone/menaquinone biosynthesis C-methylase UbiE
VIKPAESPVQQQLVNERFRAEAGRWVDFYEEDGRDFATVGSQVIRERHRQALAWIDRLSLPPGSRVLEVGGGAGLMSVALAKRGFRVTAIDASQAMVKLTRESAAKAGCADEIDAAVGDAQSLGFDDEQFDLAIAIGVISWLARPDAAIRELARVTRPGGHVLLTTFNRDQLIGFVDPLRNPLVRPLKQGAMRLAARTGIVAPAATLHYQSRQWVDQQLDESGLRARLSKTMGFGPFTLFQLKVLPAPVGMRLHGTLQRLADRGAPVLRGTGMFYMVLAEKPRTDLRSR